MNSMIGFIDSRLDAMEKYPKMWGCNESIELQYILLLEMKYDLLPLSPFEEKFMDFYLNFFKKFKTGNLSWHMSLNTETMILSLKEFRKEVEKLLT